MPVIENTMKRKLEAGDIAFSFNLVLTRLASAAGIAQECGFDWLFIDTEHNTMDLDTVSHICIAALPTAVTPIVRVASHDAFQASRVLDGGRWGWWCRTSDTAEAALQIVGNCKFPPLGHRSLTAPAPQLGFAALPVVESIEILNRITMVIVMLETPQAIGNAAAIAAVDGVDGLMIGTNDLAAEMGIPGQFGHPRIASAYEMIVAACRRHGKHAGMGGIYDNALMQRYVEMGVRFMLGGGDTAFMMSAAKERAAFLASLRPSAG